MNIATRTRACLQGLKRASMEQELFQASKPQTAWHRPGDFTRCALHLDCRTASLQAALPLPFVPATCSTRPASDSCGEPRRSKAVTTRPRPKSISPRPAAMSALRGYLLAACGLCTPRTAVYFLTIFFEATLRVGFANGKSACSANCTSVALQVGF